MAASNMSRLLALVLSCVAIPVTAAALPAVPVVYQDEHVLVRAGLVETGSQAIHLGDAVSLVVDVEFDAGTVRVETPDDEWFQRALAGVAGIRLYETVAIAEETTKDTRVRIASQWRVQVLDCPADMLSCPGSKSYELPFMTLSYQLAGGTADRIDSRSARFRPWPGRLDVASSIALQPRQGATLTDILPGGAHPPVLADPGASAAGMWLVAGGALLLLASALRTLGQEAQPARAARGTQPADTRWQHALAATGDAALTPEERSDVLRRAVTWYCLDELDVNPFAWLGPGGADAAPADATLTGWRELFLDVLGQHSVDAADAKRLADRFEQLGASRNGSPGVAP